MRLHIFNFIFDYELQSAVSTHTKSTKINLITLLYGEYSFEYILAKFIKNKTLVGVPSNKCELQLI